MAKKKQPGNKDLIPKGSPELNKIINQIDNPEVKKEVEKFLTRLLNHEGKIASKIGGEIAIREYSKKIEDWCAPLPRPKDLADYKKVYPDAPRVIIEQMEKQGNHRRKMEEIFINNDFKIIRMGQICAFILFALVCSGGIGLLCFSLLMGENIVGAITGVFTALASLGGVITVFFRKPKDDKKSLPAN